MTVDEPPLSQAEITAIAARIDRPIVLVGLMGVGKSSVGRRLAAILNLPFTDADDAIEEAAQMTIPEIFAAHGEQDFRDGERRVIARLMEQDRGVITLLDRRLVTQRYGKAILNALPPFRREIS